MQNHGCRMQITECGFYFKQINTINKANTIIPKIGRVYFPLIFFLCFLPQLSNGLEISSKPKP